MLTKTINFKEVGIAILPALGISIAVVLIGQQIGLADSTAERVSQILGFGVFIGVCNARRRHAS